jgi:chromosome segregation ATPase
VKHVFGKTLLCRNEELAKEVAMIGAFNCVTIEGTQVRARMLTFSHGYNIHDEDLVATCHSYGT